MQKSYFLPDHVSVRIHRPACPKCSALTMLARIMPARVGFDFRTFECPQCAHVHEVMVATEAFGRSFMRQAQMLASLRPRCPAYR
jgi:ribosomal protein S27AE